MQLIDQTTVFGLLKSTKKFYEVWLVIPPEIAAGKVGKPLTGMYS
jgi:hypothetical protein